MCLTQGCSLFVSRHQAVTITASDPNGRIIVDGAEVGTGSATPMLDRTRSHGVLVKTADGRNGAAAIGKRISTTGVLDIVGGCIFLVPFLGVFGPGFWELDPEQVVVSVND
jgi:hypothetical protein